jgi:hypothetical protein
MKRLIVLFGCAVLLSALAGCQGPAANNSSEFPRFLTGTWEANRKNDLNYWQIVLEPNGVISSAVIPLGGVKVRPNQTTEAKGPKGEPGFVETGDFDVYYNQQGRELAVNIKIKQFCLYLVDGSIVKGSWEYLITGNISGDEKTWVGDVFSSIDIVALVPDPNHIADESKFKEVSKLRIDLGEEEEERFIFTKVPDVNAGPR